MGMQHKFLMGSNNGTMTGYNQIESPASKLMMGNGANTING